VRRQAHLPARARDGDRARGPGRGPRRSALPARRLPGAGGLNDEGDRYRKMYLPRSSNPGKVAARQSATFLGFFKCTCPLFSAALDDGGDAHAAADAHRDQGGLLVGALELVEGDRAAVDIDLVGIDSALLDELEDDGGERFVDLEQVDVLPRHAGLLQRSLGCG